MRCRPSLISLSAVLSAALLLGACGGGAGDGGVSPPATAVNTRPQFAAQAYLICQVGNEHIGRVTEETLRKFNNPPPAVILRLTRDVTAPNVLREIRQLRAIDAPAAVKRRIAPTLAREQRFAETLERNPADPALGKGDPIATYAGATRYGLTLCGFGSSG